MGVEWEQREILFRGYDQEHQKWVYGWYTKLVEGIRVIHVIIEPDEKDNEFTRYYIHNPETITQYIGKIDTYEEKIFGGDIVEFDQKGFAGKGVIRYKDCRFVIFSSKGLIEMNYIDSKNIIIAGNIFENPEVMEGK